MRVVGPDARPSSLIAGSDLAVQETALNLRSLGTRLAGIVNGHSRLAMAILHLFDQVGYRPTAFWNLMRLARLAEGVCAARTVAACWKAGMVTELRDGPKTFVELMEALQLPRESLRVLLDSALRFRLVRRRGPYIEARSITKPFLGGPGSPLLTVSAYCASNLGGGDALLERLRQDRRQAGGFYESLGRTEAEALAEYGEYMAITAASPSETLARAWPLKQARSLLDIGGSLGHFSGALTARNPKLCATVADLPALRSFAERSFHENGHARVRFAPLDFRRDDFPTGHDAMLFARVLHDWDAATVRLLLHKARAALGAQGQIAIFEVVRERDLGNPIAVVLNQWEVLMSSVGEVRTAAQYCRLLLEAGFKDVRFRRPFDVTGWNTLITARC